MHEARLGDVVASMKNGIYKPATEYADDGMPCLRMYNIEAGAIMWRDIKRMRISEREFTGYGLHEGDLLVNRVNSRELVGKSACVPASLEPSVFESKNIRVRIDRTKALPKFVNYQLLSRGSRHFANNAQQVVGMASISQGQLADFPIVLTSLDEQRRIVAEIEKQFSRLDEAVANLQRVKAKLKRYRAVVRAVAVEGQLVPTEAELAGAARRAFQDGGQLLASMLEARRAEGKTRTRAKEPVPPAFTELPELAEGWAWASIDQLAAAEANSITDGPFGSNLKSEHYVTAGPRVIRLQNIKDGEFADERAHITEDHFARLKKHEVHSGDLVIATLGDNPPRACMIPPSVGPAIVKADCIRFKPSPSVSAAYLNIALNCQPTRARSGLNPLARTGWDLILKSGR